MNANLASQQSTAKDELPTTLDRCQGSGVWQANVTQTSVPATGGGNLHVTNAPSRLRSWMWAYFCW